MLLQDCVNRFLVVNAVRYEAIDVPVHLSQKSRHLARIRVTTIGNYSSKNPPLSIHARKIGDSRRLVCASPGYLKKAGIPKTPADLEQHNCVTWRDHPGHNTWAFRGPDGVSTVRVSGSFCAKNADALVAATVAGLGLSLLPNWNMGIELRQKRLRSVLTDYEASPTASPVYAMHAHQRHVPPKIRVFIDFLIESFAKARYS